MRFFSFAVSLFVAGCAVLSAGAPVEVRQIGNIQCNVARLGVVKGLSNAASAMKTLASAVAGTADASAVASAQANVTSAQQAVKGIATDILTGQAASADLRDQTAAGIEGATTALQGVTSTDPSLQDAMSALSSAASNGENVVSDCK